MLRRILPVLAAAFSALAQSGAPANYDGPRPPKPDVPYLKHASTLVATDVAEAKEEHKKDDILYIVPGANATARTPLAAPVFLIQAEKIAPEQLQLFKLTSREGHREILFRPKRPPQPLRVEVTRIGQPNLFRIEVEDSLEAGEYSLSPNGSNTVFCFQVF